MWGKHISTTGSLASTVGALNPFRYRGYMYDSETGLYYLQSRYYNPEWGRFINADSIVASTGDLLSTNMYAYCQNNPIMNVDPDGNMPEEQMPGPLGYFSGPDENVIKEDLAYEKTYENLSRRASFRKAKRNAGIPNAVQNKKPVYVRGGSYENRYVYEFDDLRTKQGKLYIIEHREDRDGRGPHFHIADDSKGSPLIKGIRYRQYEGHYPENKKGYY